jgi:hypothetical protein
MVRILETAVNLEYALGHHLHCLVAQLPVRLRRAAIGWEIADPDAQWRMVRSVLDHVAEGEGNLRKLHFLVLPEVGVPVARLEEALAVVADRFPANSVTAFGLGHVPLRDYRAFLERFEADNGPALDLVRRDVASGDVLDVPVNWACIAVKEATGRLRVFLEAKTHPFRGEEFLDAREDLYRGRHLWLLRAHPYSFNFMVLVCLDYVWRDVWGSNIRAVVDHANRLFFTKRQTLDALFVIQANPKPEHRVYRDVLSGFYGEYLEDTPGVRDTVTVFGNCSDESVIEGYGGEGGFGVSQVVMAARHRLARVATPEFSTDDLGGAPVSRLRFGGGTRLYYFNVPFQHEVDPRSERIPLKVHAVLRRGEGGWEKVQDERIDDPLALPSGLD